MSSTTLLLNPPCTHFPKFLVYECAELMSHTGSVAVVPNRSPEVMDIFLRAGTANRGGLMRLLLRSGVQIRNQSFAICKALHSVLDTSLNTECLCTAVRSLRPGWIIWMPFPTKILSNPAKHNASERSNHAQPFFTSAFKTSFEQYASTTKVLNTCPFDFPTVCFAS